MSGYVPNPPKNFRYDEAKPVDIHAQRWAEYEKHGKTPAPQNKVQVALRIGVFFDGTGNNANNSAAGLLCGAHHPIAPQDIDASCQPYMSDPDSSYGNDVSNVKKLSDLYHAPQAPEGDSQGKVAFRMAYIEGIGTEAGKEDNLVGQGATPSRTRLDITLMRLFSIIFSAFFLMGCQTANSISTIDDPKDPSWSLSFIGPSYMLGLVEHSTVIDVQGKSFERRSGGAIGNGTPGDETEVARGWGQVGGNIIPVVGADLPQRIFVRWQSAVEQKTYNAWVDIPEEARGVMHSSVNSRCPQTPEKPARYIASMVLGLAPGGVVQVWVRDNCHGAVKVARAKAELEPLGPFLGKQGNRPYPKSEASRRYVEKFGIPYGSW